MSPIDPIDNIQCTIGTFEQDVFVDPCNILNLSIAKHEKELRENSKRFQANGKSPKEIQEIERPVSSHNVYNCGKDETR